MMQRLFSRLRPWAIGVRRLRRPSFRRIACAVSASSLVVAAGASALPPRSVADSLVATSLATIVARGNLASIRMRDLRDVKADLNRAYLPRAWAPIWLANGQPTPAALAALAALSRVGERGLDPAAYDASALGRLARAPLTSADERAEFDMMLSVATLRALRAITFGRVVVTDVHPTLRIVRDSVDMAAMVTQMAEMPVADSLFDAAEPQFAGYQSLKRALALSRARFARNDSLALTREARIALTMERWRWLPRTFAVPPVIVNLPAYTLMSLGNDSAAAALSMDVVVGSTGAHQSPILADSIRLIEFAPYWNVPMSIVKGELMRVAMRDPHILTMNNYEIVNRRGQVVVPTVASLRRVRAGEAFIRQLPGGTNSLGRVKFLFPNAFDVYLHDSPVQMDFKKTRRDQSHGCIRVSDPTALATWLLRDQPDWTADRIERAMNGRTPTRLPLTRSVPIYLFYATVVAAPDGGVQFHNDIYGFDAVLAEQLARGVASKATGQSTLAETDSRPQ